MASRILFAAALFATLPASAQDASGKFDLSDYPQRMQEAVAACSADPASADCFVEMKSVLPTTVEALSFLGYESTYNESAPLLREMADFPEPHVAAAAIYALARLGPKTEDLPALRNALLNDVSGVRRAAIGALKLLPDPQAQELYTRAVPSPNAMPSGYFSSERLPFDPAQAGVAAWPEGSRYLFFQNRVNQGTYVFTATADVAQTLAGFEAQAGSKAVGMGDLASRFGTAYGDLLAPWAARNETLGAVQAVVLGAAAEPSAETPVTLVLVYEDYALGATGFALVRLPGQPLPRPDAIAEPTPPTPSGEAAIWFGSGKFEPKANAATDDVAGWREVEDSEGALAQAYLDKFPEGAYRAEAEALLAAPAIETDLDIYAETDPIKVHWRGVPAAEGMRLTLGRAEDSDLFSTSANSAPDVTAPEGDAELGFSPYTEPGVYDLRIVDQFGEPVAVKQIRIALTTAQLSLEKESFKPGEDIAVAFKGMAGTPEDFVSIVKKGEKSHIAGSLRTATGGRSEGNLTLTAPSEPGEYELRAWFNGEARLRGRVSFTVRGPDLPPEIADPSKPGLAIAAPEYPANEKIIVRFAGFPAEKGNYVALAAVGSPNTVYVTYKDLLETSGTVELALPPEPGSYELRGFVGGRTDTVPVMQPIAVTAPAGTGIVTLTLDKASYAPGETIGIDFANMSGSKNDSVVIAEKGSRYSAFISYAYTKGEKAGRAELKAPTQPGDYEVRAFYRDDSSVLRGVVEVTVTGP